MGYVLQFLDDVMCIYKQWQYSITNKTSAPITTKFCCTTKTNSIHNGLHMESAIYDFALFTHDSLSEFLKLFKLN